MRNTNIILAGKPEGKRPRRVLGVRRRIILKLILKEIGWESVDWIELAQDCPMVD
jgi:hypothetical protein